MPSPQLVGVAGSDLDLNAVQRAGVEVVGRFAGVHNGQAQFSGGIANACKSADLKAGRLLKRFEDYLAGHQAVGRCDVGARELLATEAVAPAPLAPTVIESDRLSVNLKSGEVRTVLWATGFTPEFDYLDVDVFDRKGQLRHEGGVTPAPGIFALGLPLLNTRASSFIYGAERDVTRIAQHLQAHLDATARPAVRVSA